jgi:hypothetical protein
MVYERVSTVDAMERGQAPETPTLVERGLFKGLATAETFSNASNRFTTAVNRMANEEVKDVVNEVQTMMMYIFKRAERVDPVVERNRQGSVRTYKFCLDILPILLLADEFIQKLAPSVMSSNAYQIVRLVIGGTDGAVAVIAFAFSLCTSW